MLLKYQAVFSQWQDINENAAAISSCILWQELLTHSFCTSEGTVAHSGKAGPEKSQDADAALTPRLLGSTPSQMAAKPQAGPQPAKASTAKPPLERMTSSISQGKVLLHSELAIPRKDYTCFVRTQYDSTSQ